MPAPRSQTLPLTRVLWWCCERRGPEWRLVDWSWRCTQCDGQPPAEEADCRSGGEHRSHLPITKVRVNWCARYIYTFAHFEKSRICKYFHITPIIVSILVVMCFETLIYSKWAAVHQDQNLTPQKQFFPACSISNAQDPDLRSSSHPHTLHLSKFITLKHIFVLLSLHIAYILYTLSCKHLHISKHCTALFILKTCSIFDIFLNRFF